MCLKCSLSPCQSPLKPAGQEVVENGSEDHPLVIVRHIHVSDHVEVPHEARSDVGPATRLLQVVEC